MFFFLLISSMMLHQYTLLVMRLSYNSFSSVTGQFCAYLQLYSRPVLCIFAALLSWITHAHLVWLSGSTSLSTSD